MLRSVPYLIHCSPFERDLISDRSVIRLLGDLLE